MEYEQQYDLNSELEDKAGSPPQPPAVPRGEETQKSVDALVSMGSVVSGDPNVENSVSTAEQQTKAGQLDQALDPTYRRLLEKDTRDLETAARDAAAAGNVSEFVRLVNAAVPDMTKYQDASEYMKASRIAIDSAQYAATGNPSILANNTPEQIAVVTETVGKAIAGDIVIQHAIDDAKQSIDAMSWAGSIGVAIAPFLTPIRDSQIQNTLEKYTGTSRGLMDLSSAIEDFRILYRTTPEDKQGALLTSVISDLKNIGLASNIEIAALLEQMMSREGAASRSVEDSLNLLFGGIDVAGVGEIARAGYVAHKYRTAAKKTLADKLAKVAGADAVGNVVGDTIQTQGTNALGMTHQAQVESAISASLARMLGESMSGASTAVQTKLIEKSEELIGNLRSTLTASGKTNEEISDAIKKINSTYDPAVNKSIYSVDVGQSLSGDRDLVVFYQSFNGKPYVTKEAAEAAAAVRGGGFEVVPANANTEWLLKKNEIADLENKVSQIKASITALKPRLRWAEIFDGSAEAADRLQRLTQEYGASLGTLQQPAFHGTAYNFKNFNFDKAVRTSVGWGAYFTMSAAIAGRYAKASKNWKARKHLSIHSPETGWISGSHDDIWSDLAERHAAGQLSDDRFADLTAQLDLRLSQRQEKLSYEDAYIMKFEIPENDKLFDWDGAMSTQTPLVQQAFKELGIVPLRPTETVGSMYARLADELGSQQAASKALHSKGVQGHYYDAELDKPAGIVLGNSEKNFVIYDKESIEYLSKDFLDIDDVMRSPINEDFVESALKANKLYNAHIADSLDELAKLPELPNIDPKLFDSKEKQGVIRAAVKLMEGLGLDPKSVKIASSRTLMRGDTKEGYFYKTLRERYSGAAGGRYDPELRLIIIEDSNVPTLLDFTNVLIHEIGHHYIYSRIKNNPSIEKSLMTGFVDWIKEKHPRMMDNTGLASEIADFYKAYRSVNSETIMQYRRGDNEVADMAIMLQDWLGSYHEFYAEQFTKWTFRSELGERLISAGAPSFVKQIITWIKEVYREVRKVFPGSAIVTKDFNQFMEDWVATIENQRQLGLGMFFDSDKKLEYDSLYKALSVHELITNRMPESRILNELKDAEDALQKAKDAEASLSAGWLLKKRETVFDENTVGKFTDDDINSIAFVAADPLHGTSKFLYEERMVGVHAEAKIKKALSDFVAEPFDKLSSAEATRVQNLLIEGDSYSNAGGVGKEFTAAELTARGFSENEQVAYFSARALRNVMHEIRDSRMAARLREQGYSKVTITMKDGGDQFVSAGKRVGFNDYIGKTVWDSEAGKAITLTRAQVDKSIREGNVLASTAETLVTETGKEYNLFVVPANSIKESAIHTVLPKRPGEFARIYTEPYFITTSVKRVINDDDVVDTFNVKTAASKHEASQYTSAMNSAVALHKAGKLTLQELDKLVGKWEDTPALWEKISGGAWSDIPDNPFSFHYNRMEDDYIRDFTKSAIEEGRLFTSKRGVKLDSVSSLSDVGNTMDPMSALQAEITNVSRFTTISAWRDSAIQRWHNTFKDILPTELRNATPEQAFFRMGSYKYTSDDQRAIAAQRVYNYVLRQIGTPTKEEEFFRGMTKQLTDKFMPEGKFGTAVGGFLRNASPTRFLRTFSFHTMLGLFNPAQLLVQSVGAATAVAIHPIHGLAAAKTVPMLRMALMSDNEAVWRTIAAANKYGSLGLGSVDDFVDTVKAIRKTGIIDGINSTSLYNIEDGRFNVFSKTVRKASEASAFFFNRGEEFTRLVGFDVARREWIKANKGKDWRADESLKEILVRQDSFTQNMTRANENLLQRGVLSIPTQFLQYNIKLGMNIAGAFQTGAVNVKRKLTGEELRAYRGFTPAEAAQVLLANFILWGAAYNGVPDFVEEWIGDKAKDMSEEQRLYLTQGAIAGMLNSSMKLLNDEGMALATGKRFNALQWYEDVAKGVTALFTGKSEVNPAELMLGASYASLSRLGAVGKQMYLWYKDPNLSADDLADGMRVIASETIITLKNVDKMYLAYNTGYMYDPKGNKIATANKAEAIAQMLSVPPAEVADYYKSIEYRQKHFDRLRDIAKHYVALQREWYRAENLRDFNRANDIRKAAQALIANMPVSDWVFVTNEAKNKVMPYDTALEKEVLEFNNRALLSPESAKPLTTVR